MKNFKLKNTLLLIFTAGLSIALYYWFLNSEYFLPFDTWVRANLFAFVVYLFTFKIMSILWPPLTGGLATLASIPFLGWFNAYLIDLVGSLVGGAIAYTLGKNHGFKILEKLFDKELVKKVRKIKIKKGREIEALFIYRLFFGSTIVEIIYYGAGLLKIGFKNFLVGATLSHVVVGVPSYFFANNLIEGKNVLLVVLSLALGIPFFLKFKKRHFE